MNELLKLKKEIHRKLIQGEIINKYKIVYEEDSDLKMKYKAVENDYFTDIFTHTNIEDLKSFFIETKSYFKSLGLFIHTDTVRGKYDMNTLEDLNDYRIQMNENITSLVVLDEDKTSDVFFSINSNKNNAKSENVKDIQALLKIVKENMHLYQNSNKETIIYLNPGFSKLSFLKSFLVFSEDSERFLIPNIVLFNLISIIAKIERVNLNEEIN